MYKLFSIASFVSIYFVSSIINASMCKDKILARNDKKELNKWRKVKTELTSDIGVYEKTIGNKLFRSAPVGEPVQNKEIWKRCIIEDIIKRKIKIIENATTVICNGCCDIGTNTVENLIIHSWSDDKLFLNNPKAQEVVARFFRAKQQELRKKSMLDELADKAALDGFKEQMISAYHALGEKDSNSRAIVANFEEMSNKSPASWFAMPDIIQMFQAYGEKKDTIIESSYADEHKEIREITPEFSLSDIVTTPLASLRMSRSNSLPSSQLESQPEAVESSSSSVVKKTKPVLTRQPRQPLVSPDEQTVPVGRNYALQRVDSFNPGNIDSCRFNPKTNQLEIRLSSAWQLDEKEGRYKKTTDEWVLADSLYAGLSSLVPSGNSALGGLGHIAYEFCREGQHLTKGVLDMAGTAAQTARLCFRSPEERKAHLIRDVQNYLTTGNPEFFPEKRTPENKAQQIAYARYLAKKYGEGVFCTKVLNRFADEKDIFYRIPECDCNVCIFNKAEMALPHGSTLKPNASFRKGLLGLDEKSIGLVQEETFVAEQAGAGGGSTPLNYPTVFKPYNQHHLGAMPIDELASIIPALPVAFANYKDYLQREKITVQRDFEKYVTEIEELVKAINPQSENDQELAKILKIYANDMLTWVNTQETFIEESFENVLQDIAHKKESLAKSEADLFNSIKKSVSEKNVKLCILSKFKDREAMEKNLYEGFSIETMIKDYKQARELSSNQDLSDWFESELDKISYGETNSKAARVYEALFWYGLNYEQTYISVMLPQLSRDIHAMCEYIKEKYPISFTHEDVAIKQESRDYKSLILLDIVEKLRLALQNFKKSFTDLNK